MKITEENKYPFGKMLCSKNCDLDNLYPVVETSNMVRELLPTIINDSNVDVVTFNENRGRYVIFNHVPRFTGLAKMEANLILSC